MKGVKNKLKLKKGDKVIVRAGRDRGKTGEVLGVFPNENRALVSNVNMLWHHDKPSQSGPGGRAQKEGRIHISNLSLVDPKDSKPTRVGYKRLENGRKVRITRRSGEVVDHV